MLDAYNSILNLVIIWLRFLRYHNMTRLEQQANNIEILTSQNKRNPVDTQRCFNVAKWLKDSVVTIPF